MRFVDHRRAASAVVAVFVVLSATLYGKPQLSTAVERPTAELTRPTPMDPDDVAGLVVSLKGPEAGVWVIAESRVLPTKFVRIVVTNEEGRYVLPDLPNGPYEVFARGYGFVDFETGQGVARAADCLSGSSRHRRRRMAARAILRPYVHGASNEISS